MNYMEQVAKMLGVELGEEFRIGGVNEYYFLTCEGLRTKRGGGPYDSTLASILTGSNTIKRKPWKPKHGDTYWFVKFSHGHFCDFTTYAEGNIEDESRVKLGIAFSTKEQAVEAAKKMLKALEVNE